MRPELDSVVYAVRRDRSEAEAVASTAPDVRWFEEVRGGATGGTPR
jgi:hypothetical protein